MAALVAVLIPMDMVEDGIDMAIMDVMEDDICMAIVEDDISIDMSILVRWDSTKAAAAWDEK